MIGLVIAAVLIVRTYGGGVSVQEGLSDHACAEAASVAQTGRTIEAEAEFQSLVTAERAKRESEWAAKNPKEKAQCEARNKRNQEKGLITWGCMPLEATASSGFLMQMNPSDIRSATCAK